MEKPERSPDTTVRMLKAFAIAIALAVPAEGLRQVAYRDSPGVLTVCYGSTSEVREGVTYSLKECRERLAEDMLEAVETVERCVPGLPEHMLAAWSDTVYNVGQVIVCDKTRSTAARLLAEGRLIEACHELPRWNKATIGGIKVELPGLTKRRARAKELCLSGRA